MVCHLPECTPTDAHSHTAACAAAAYTFRGEKGVPVSAAEGETSVRPAMDRDSVCDSVADTPQRVMPRASGAATDFARRCMITQRYKRDQTAETETAELPD